MVMDHVLKAIDARDLRYFDQMGFMAQLGLAEPVARPTAPAGCESGAHTRVRSWVRERGGVVMLQCTQAAATTLREVRQTQGLPESYGIRVFGASGPEGEVGLGIGFAEQPADGDQVAESAGTRLFVAPEVADDLSEMALDVVPAPSNDGSQPPQLVLVPRR